MTGIAGSPEQSSEGRDTTRTSRISKKLPSCPTLLFGTGGHRGDQDCADAVRCLESAIIERAQWDKADD
jgi:hypothetical protein